jgi:hypothetical protein
MPKWEYLQGGNLHLESMFNSKTTDKNFEVRYTNNKGYSNNTKKLKFEIA